MVWLTAAETQFSLDEWSGKIENGGKDTSRIELEAVTKWLFEIFA